MTGILSDVVSQSHFSRPGGGEEAQSFLKGERPDHSWSGPYCVGERRGLSH